MSPSYLRRAFKLLHQTQIGMPVRIQLLDDRKLQSIGPGVKTVLDDCAKAAQFFRLPTPRYESHVLTRTRQPNSVESALDASAKNDDSHRAVIYYVEGHRDYRSPSIIWRLIGIGARSGDNRSQPAKAVP